MRIMLELLTEDGQFQVLLILFLALTYGGNYRLNHMWPLNPLMEKLDECTRLSRKLRQSGATRKP